MAREAKDPHAGKDALTLGDGKNRFNVDMSMLRGLGKVEGKSEQQEYLDNLYENFKKREAEREAAEGNKDEDK